jgi:hypothetical protein
LRFRRAATERWVGGWGLLAGCGWGLGRADTPGRGGRAVPLPLEHRVVRAECEGLVSLWVMTVGGGARDD